MSTASTTPHRVPRLRRMLVALGIIASCASFNRATASVDPLEDTGSVEADRDPMAHALRLMTETGKRLGEKLDPGPETQAMQQRILERPECVGHVQVTSQYIHTIVCIHVTAQSHLTGTCLGNSLIGG